MLKIYFACSIRGGREDAAVYAQLIQMIGGRAQVLTEIFGDPDLTDEGMTHKGAQAIHDQDLAWIAEADAVIAEVTTPSLGVGYEIGHAEATGKPVLALYHAGGARQLSAMIEGSQQTRTAHYTSVEDAANIVDTFLAELRDKR